MTIRSLFLLALVVISITSCGCKEDPVAPTPPLPESARMVYLLNEGNFGRSNSTLSVYFPDSAIMINDAFARANGRKLGDTGNSLTLFNGVLYIVMNGTNTVEAVDPLTMTSLRTIQCPTGASPRTIAFSATGRGYISNLYLNSVSVVEATSGTIIKEIPVGNNPEQILVHEEDVYVANSGFGNGRSVSIISNTSLSVVSTVPVSDCPSAFAKLNESRALILCSGAYNDFSRNDDDTPGALYFLDLATRRVTDSLVLEGHPKLLTLDGKGNAYTIGEEGVVKIRLEDKSVTRSFIPGFFYSLAYDQTRDLLYVTNPLDFVQAGMLEVYSPTGTLLSKIGAGIIPGAILPSEQ